MKRDPELLRALLIEMEDSHSPILVMTMDRSVEDSHHIQLLCDEGLVEECARYNYRLTSSGHDFLEAIRDESRWQKVMGRVQDSGGNWTLDILKQLAVQLLKETVLRG